MRAVAPQMRWPSTSKVCVLNAIPRRTILRSPAPATSESRESSRTWATSVSPITHSNPGSITLVLGTRNGSLPDPPGVALGGQIYNVYELVQGRIREIRDFAARNDALQAAGANGEWR